MTRRIHLGLALATLTLLTAGCGRQPGGTDAASTTQLATSTPKARSGDRDLTWATYRAVATLDPIQAFDYPENTAITSMCESLLRQDADGTVGPGLATVSRPDPKTVVLKLRSDARFWNGKPVTAADVAYDLGRAADARLGSFYAPVLARVARIEATAADTVTLKLSAPDYWLDGELSQMAGIVYEKAYAQRAGKRFGTPAGGTMCTGAFKLGDWQAGTQLTAERHPDYWDPAGRAKSASITFKGVPDDASVTSGLLTGAIDGTYLSSYGTLRQLEGSDAVTVTPGPSFATDALIVSDLDGPLGDVRVRRALSLAVDRAGDVSSVYQGQAQLPRTLANPGTWGYARDTFQAAWDRTPEPARDLTEAKRLLQEAGAVGKTIVIGNEPEVGIVNGNVLAFREAGRAIGLNVKIKAVSAQDYVNFFTDAAFRSDVDGFATVNYPDSADPAGLYASMALPGGPSNYSGFRDARITSLLERARATADPEDRATLVAQAGDRITQLLPWIPMALPNTVLVTSRSVTGAPPTFQYMGGPWAAGIGER